MPTLRKKHTIRASSWLTAAEASGDMSLDAMSVIVYSRDRNTGDVRRSYVPVRVFASSQSAVHYGREISLHLTRSNPGFDFYPIYRHAVIDLS